MQDPVVLAIILQRKFTKERVEKVAQVLVVWLLLEGQIACVVHVLLEGQWTAFAKLLNCRICLGLQDGHGPLILRLFFQELLLVSLSLFYVYLVLCRPWHIPR